MIIKHKTICSGCYKDLLPGDEAVGKKVGGVSWSFLCVTCAAKIEEQGSSAWWNPRKAIEALAYYNCDLADELDHHDWDLLRLFGISPV